MTKIIELIYTRRLLMALPFVGGLFGNTRPKYAVPPILWYENAAGEKWVPDLTQNNGLPDPPEGFIYQHSQFPRDLHHSCCTHEGPLFSGSSSWPEDLVLAMAVSGDYKLSEAILIAANLCERCMNAAAHDYGLKWGYRRGSAGWVKCNTECQFCVLEVE